MTLLASSNTIAGITQMVNKFWYSEAYTVDPTTLRICHPEKDVNAKVRIVKVKNRYRFESI